MLRLSSCLLAHRGQQSWKASLRGLKPTNGHSYCSDTKGLFFLLFSRMCACICIRTAAGCTATLSAQSYEETYLRPQWTPSFKCCILTRCSCMPLKCCVTGCTSNYNTADEYTTVFRLPKDKVERDRWLRAIPPDNVPDTDNTVVCEKHWPHGYRTVQKKGRTRPASPRSIFANITISQIPTPTSKPRQNSKALNGSRSAQPDELPVFDALDAIAFDNLKNVVSDNFAGEVIYVDTAECVVIQSKVYEGGIPRFVLKIKPDLSYTAFHVRMQCNIGTLSKNRVFAISEIVCFARSDTVFTDARGRWKAGHSCRSTRARCKIGCGIHCMTCRLVWGRGGWR